MNKFIVIEFNRCDAYKSKVHHVSATNAKKAAMSVIDPKGLDPELEDAMVDFTKGKHLWADEGLMTGEETNILVIPV